MWNLWTYMLGLETCMQAKLDELLLSHGPGGVAMRDVSIAIKKTETPFRRVGWDIRLGSR